MKTVWHLISNRWNSAITEYALSAAKSLEMRGMHNIVSGLRGKAADNRAQALGLKVEPFTNFEITSLINFWSLLNKIQPDVIMVYGGQENALTGFVRGIPVIRFRGDDRDVRGPSFWQSLFAKRLTSGLLFPSSSLQVKWSEIGIPSEVVMLGINNPNIRLQSELTRYDRPTMIVLGRLDPIKGHGSFFLRFKCLLSEWPSEYPAPFLKIIGEAANISTDQIRAFARDVNLVEGEHWELVSTRVKNLSEILNQAHLGVIPSQGSEVICRVAQEFLVCGLPIFVSGVGSLEECLVREDFGTSYQGLPEMKIAKSLRDLLLDSFLESAETRCLRARKAEELFSLDRMGKSLEVYLDQFGPIHLRGLDPSAPPTKP